MPEGPTSGWSIWSVATATDPTDRDAPTRTRSPTCTEATPDQARPRNRAWYQRPDLRAMPVMVPISLPEPPEPPPTCTSEVPEWLYWTVPKVRPTILGNCRAAISAVLARVSHVL